MAVVKLHARSRRDDHRFLLLNQAAERMRLRAWGTYLEATREAPDYQETEPEAWRRLQERLAAIDEELLSALGAAER
jgi:hypothetical protein